MAFTAPFDLLEIDGHSALAEPWRARRKRLEDLLEVPRLVSVSYP
jgi:ATP-dependent DNA ligase